MIESLPDYEEFSKDEKIAFLKNNGWIPQWSEDNWVPDIPYINNRAGMLMEDAFDVCIENIKVKIKMQTPLNIVDWNTMSMDEYTSHLTQKFQFDSSGTAKAVFELIDFYRANKDRKNQDRKLLTTFVRDLNYCSADDDGYISIITEDAKFYADAFIDSEDYEAYIKSKNESEDNSQA